MIKPAFPQYSCIAALVATGLIAVYGCHSAPETRDLMVEEAHADPSARPIAMRGEASFADGKLGVVATVARGFQRVGTRGAGGGKGGAGRHWRSKDVDAFSDDYSFGSAETEEQQKEAVQEYVRQAMARRAAGSPMPPVTLRVTFENQGTEPMEVVPTEINSDLGNFAVRPTKLSLAPGATGELDPMISQLGVTNDVIPLTVSVRVGAKSETRVITIKSVIAPAALK
jgi:hypothetical protein